MPKPSFGDLDANGGKRHYGIRCAYLDMFIGVDGRGASSTPATAQKPAAQAAKAEGFAYCAGATKHGAIGLPHAGEPLTAPRLQTRLMKEGVVQVSCGWRHSAYVLSSGEVYTCGEGTNGKLGSGQTASLPEPQPVAFGTELFVMQASLAKNGCNMAQKCSKSSKEISEDR